MSNQSIKHSIEPRKRAFTVYRMILCMALLICTGLLPPVIHGEEMNADPVPPLPLLVSARRGDTPATIARRYLNDASKGWMIGEYNGIVALSGGQAVMVPLAPFRPGGLTPDGYQTVPVLAYSDIGESPGQKQRVSRSAFNDQMRWLKTEGFTAITPMQLIDFTQFSSQLPQRAVLITADTESRALYDQGVPVLKELGFTATVFVATEVVGNEGAMTWDQLRQLREAGFTIGCRGRSGRSLTRQKNGQAFEAYFKSIESELRLAKKEIETRLGAPCPFLAYPRGSTSGLVAAMAAKLGFSAAFIRSPGDNPFFGDRFGIHRIAIDGRINPEKFGKMLTTLITADLN